jgi:hypothetical protein
MATEGPEGLTSDRAHAHEAEILRRPTLAGLTANVDGGSPFERAARGQQI